VRVAVAVECARPFDGPQGVGLGVAAHFNAEVLNCDAGNPARHVVGGADCVLASIRQPSRDAVRYAGMGDTRSMGRFWDRVSDWCRGSAMVGTRSVGGRQPCPVCGKVVRVHFTGRFNAHLPAKPAA